MPTHRKPLTPEGKGDDIKAIMWHEGESKEVLWARSPVTGRKLTVVIPAVLAKSKDTKVPGFKRSHAWGYKQDVFSLLVE